MALSQILIYAAGIIIIIILLVVGRFARIYLSQKMLDATQKGKPKSRLQKFFGW